MPLDKSGITVRVKPLPPTHLEHFGTPCSLTEIEVTVSGTFRITWECDSDLTPSDEEAYYDHIQAHVQEELEDLLPIYVDLGEDYGRVKLIMMGSTEMHKTYAVFEILDWEHE